MCDKGRRGRLGGVPEYISRLAEEFQREMEPPYDSDDIITSFECGYLKAIKNETD